jgi:iron(III) transport system permease protein
VGRESLTLGRLHPTWRPEPWLAGALAVVLVSGALPLAWLGLEAIGRGALAAEALRAARTLALLANTASLGLVVAALAGLAGTALAVLAAKTDLPWPRALGALLTFPLFLPPFVLALGWFTVLGREGLVTGVGGPEAGARASELYFGPAGAALVLAVAYTPIAFHLVRIGLAAVDPAAEEAARLHRGWRRALQLIDLPLVIPSIALAMLVTFILVVGELGVPAFLRYPVFSAEVFAQFAAFLDIRSAVAMSLPLALLVLVGLAIERGALRHRVQFLPRHRLEAAIAPLGRWRPLVGAAAWGWVVATVLLPLAGLAVRAGALASYRVALQGAGASIVRSLWMSAVAATAILALALALAYLVERTRPRRRDGLDTALLLLFAAPGTVLGVGLILVWNRAGFGWLYGSTAIVVLGWIAHFTPLATRAVGIALRALPRGLEEAARLARASWGRTVVRVLVPAVSSALAGAWLLAFIFCLRDLDLAITIYPPGAETLPVRVYTLMANSPEPVVAALAVLTVGVTALVVAAGAGGWLAVRRISAR